MEDETTNLSQAVRDLIDNDPTDVRGMLLGVISLASAALDATDPMDIALSTLSSASEDEVSEAVIRGGGQWEQAKLILGRLLNIVDDRAEQALEHATDEAVAADVLRAAAEEFHEDALHTLGEAIRVRDAAIHGLISHRDRMIDALVARKRQKDES